MQKAISDLDKTRHFNDFFSSVFTCDNGCMPSKSTNTQSVYVGGEQNKFSSVIFTPEKILKAIKELKLNGSPGFDGIPPKVFKKLQNSLVFPLLLLFNASLQFGEIPHE